jgi:hypothetical protein
MPPAMSSSQQEEACDSASETDHQAVAREAAVKVQEDFDARSELKDVNPDAAIALYDPEEVLVEDTIYSGFFCIVSALRGISLRPSHFEDSIEEHRDRFAGRSHDGHYALKSISPESVKQDEETARIAAATLMIEAKILMNLAPHPHICQLYGLNASGTNTAFGSKISQDGFFLIIDSISETLPQRMTAWREKRCYHEEERFDDLKTKQSQLTQRLEVALDICSPMIFLSKRKIVYCFHPEKCGFDSRYKRIKLFHFGHARESGKEPYSIFINEDMRYRAYLAPEIFKRGTVTCDADVYAFGMLLWEILTLKHPLEGMSNASHITQVVNGRTRPPINKTWPESIRKLIESCWTATDRPTMKEVYDSLKEVHDSLEHFLLFQQDVEGIERTEDQISGMAPQVESTKRRIKYERTGETVTEEERDKDSKSVKSRESVRSRDSKVSVRSNRSRGSAENKTERRPRRKSNDQVCVEESALQVSQEDKGEPLLLKVADSGRDEKPVEDAADSKSPSHVKDKNGRIRRNRSYSADDIIVNDDDDQSSGRRSTSSRLSSVRDKDGKIRRTAVKPDTSNDDNESTAHKSVGSNESLSRRRRPPSGREASKRNLHDTLEGLGKDEDVATPDGNQRQRSSRHLSRDGVVEKPEDDKGEPSSLPKVADSLSSVKDKDGKIRRTAVKPDTSNDDNESTAHKSVGSNESLSRRRRPPSRMVSKRNLHDMRPNMESNGKNEGGGRILRRGVARSKSSDDGLLSHQASSPRRAAVLGSENNDTEDESCGRPLGSPHRGVARSRSSDEALKQQLSSRRLISAENSPRRAAAGSENNDTEESGGRPMGSPRRGVARSRSSDETLKQQLSSRRLTSAENNDNNDESGTGRAADACLSRRNILARSKSSGDGAPNDQPPSRTRPMNRRKSGDNALTFMAATTSRKAPATRRMGRRRSVSATTYLAARSVQPASSVREAPSQRLVGRSASSGKEIPGITAWLGGAPIEEPKSRDGGFADFDGSSFPDLGVVERHKNKKASEENNFSLSMSEHSNWVDLAVADKKQDEKKDPAASSNPFGNKTEKMRSGSENDTKGAIRKRILDKAKEMAKEKEERERAAHGLPISEDFQRRRVQVAATTAAAATRGPVVISRQRSTRQLKRAP